MFFTAKQALEFWQKEGLLTKQKAAELEDSLEGSAAQVPHRAILIFSGVGAILIGLGVILFIASNWAEMSATLKTGILMVGMLGTAAAGYYLAYERKSYEIVGLALLFVNILLFGASIFLVAQIYHLPLTFWWGALLWFLAAAAFAYILQSRMHLWLAVPLLLLFLGWLRTYGVTGFASELDFLTNGRDSLLPLLPVIGAGVLSVGVLHRKHPFLRFGENTLFHWGVFLTLLIIVVSTADKHMLFNFLRLPQDPLSLTIVAGGIVAVLAAVSFGNFVTDQGRWGLLGLALYLAFIHIIAQVPEWMGYPMMNGYVGYMGAGFGALEGLFVIHVVLVFVLLLTVVWYGTLLKLPAMINLGMLGLAVTILIQYFSWAFEMLDRSVAFILGGILILALSAILERKRRQLVSSTKK
ncbi:hypothetical protein A3D88_00795 [Candidatus Peribacteria bacterium RIFCSPHIGHO2_02_FULL_52_16]|nr:MAG: hypothetical protein A2706_00865 [Candidatus Peribacteria bacterium RIFCSPHIGHO2_01_FULL_51_35]OGJ61207.1 MAG: hypothetical protein A3D88_00795 [Candidatus Peribacteria bacterium RIFCSPHIGHO2_02_FULL_52_16]